MNLVVAIAVVLGAIGVNLASTWLAKKLNVEAWGIRTVAMVLVGCIFSPGFKCSGPTIRCRGPRRARP